ncbi:MAG: indole-3-glycerol phosphate synthase TrpC [Gammaproteobacteria bacterium]|nr:indole-3-glycerol phosphate synthase TrpC [Gammaproteobacteria bacterium]
MYLQRIIEYKYQEIYHLKKQELNLIKLAESGLPTRKFSQSIENLVSQGQAAIIAEIKPASPSKGWIKKLTHVASVAQSYTQHGATCISVLTDQAFFRGSADHLKIVRNNSHLPILMKEFIVDPVQIYWAKILGADCILLIASCLPPHLIYEFEAIARSLDLDVLVEVHSAQEYLSLPHLKSSLIGVNNRNLLTFEVNIETSIQLNTLLSKDKILISESGINHPDDLKMLQDHNIFAYLIGEHFMRADDPGERLERLFQRA